MRSFVKHCVAGLEVNEIHARDAMEGSLMLVTALVPHIGYDRAARIAKYAHESGATLREAALSLGELTPEQFDRWVDARQMLGPRTT